jgi:hypothetical protein
MGAHEGGQNGQRARSFAATEGGEDSDARGQMPAYVATPGGVEGHGTGGVVIQDALGMGVANERPAVAGLSEVAGAGFEPATFGL